MDECLRARAVGVPAGFSVRDFRRYTVAIQNGVRDEGLIRKGSHRMTEANGSSLGRSWVHFAYFIFLIGQALQKSAFREIEKRLQISILFSAWQRRAYCVKISRYYNLMWQIAIRDIIVIWKQSFQFFLLWYTLRDIYLIQYFYYLFMHV